MREWKALRERGDKSPDPRLSVLEAASEILLEWGEKALMMDANANLQEKQMETFMIAHGLCGLIATTNEGEIPGTYIRSGNRLDYILGTAHVKQAVVRSGSLESHEGVSCII